MPIAKLNDCKFYYEVTGSGPDVSFVHGEDHASDLFAHQIVHFSKRFRCITYDRRGHGKTELTPYGYSLHNQTLDLTELLDHLQVSRPIIVAVAMATPIAVSFALTFPDRIRGLALASWYELDGYPLMEMRRPGPIFGNLRLTRSTSQNSVVPDPRPTRSSSAPDTGWSGHRCGPVCLPTVTRCTRSRGELCSQPRLILRGSATGLLIA